MRAPTSRRAVVHRATSRLVVRSLSALAAALLLLATPSAAQSPAVLAASCVEGGGTLDSCLAGATAGYSFVGHVSLLSSLGSPVPGSASNLGTRPGGSPRLSFHGQLSASSWDLPDLGQVPDARSSWVPSLRLGGAAGLFDGFRIMPTVGGLLATDVFVDGAIHLPSGSDGFDGSVRSLAVGTRIGIFREGFTVPGVSVSVARRFFGESEYGGLADGDVAGVVVDPAVTSIRAMVSKDLFAVELMAGFGWEDFTADAVLEVPDDPTGTLTFSGPMSGSRRLVFGSASMTFSLFLSLTVEGGWAGGLSPIPAYVGEHDPSGGTGFASVSARLVL